LHTLQLPDYNPPVQRSHSS